MNHGYRAPLLALAGLGLVAAAGCASNVSEPSHATPATVVSLPSDPPTGTSRQLAPATVRLTPGQSFAVRHVVSAQPDAWTQASGGDTRIVRHTSSVVLTPCPGGTTGCGTPTDDLYTARAAGTTTLTWSYGSRMACSPSAAQNCWHVTKPITVIVG